MFLNLISLNPLTGDSRNMILFIILGIVALLAVAGLVVWRVILSKKEKGESKDESKKS